MDFASAVNAAFGARLRQARSAKGFSQGELASLVGLSRVTIATIETGKQNVQLQHLFLFARALNVAVDTLIPMSDEVGMRQRASLSGVVGYAASGKIFLEDARVMLRLAMERAHDHQAPDSPADRRTRGATPRKARSGDGPRSR